MEDNKNYIHALRFKWLNRFYDTIIALTMRENLFRSKMVHLFSQQKSFKLLDVACGTGTFLTMLKRKNSQLSLTGLDGDPSIIKIAEKKSAKFGDEISYKEGFSTSLPFESHSFDAVTTSLFFHHLNRDDKLKTLLEMKRVLSKDGILVVCDWDRPSWLGTSLGFLFLQLIDGFKTTRDHREGLLSDFISSAGFDLSEKKQSIDTIFGTLSIWITRSSQNG